MDDRRFGATLSAALIFTRVDQQLSEIGDDDVCPSRRKLLRLAASSWRRFALSPKPNSPRDLD